MEKMKKKIFSTLVVGLLIVVSVAVFVACKNQDESGKNKLATPTNLSIDTDTQILSWDEVENAVKYRVEVNAKSKATYEPTGNQLNLSSLNSNGSQTYTITVQALGDNKNWTDSDKSQSIEYTTSGLPNLSSECDIVKADGFTLQDSTYTMTVDGTVETQLDLNPLIQVSPKATWAAFMNYPPHPNYGQQLEDNIVNFEDLDGDDLETNDLLASFKIVVTAEDGVTTQNFVFFVLAQ